MQLRVLRLEPQFSSAAWDAALAQHPWQVVYNALPTDAPTTPALRMLAVLPSGNPEAIEGELARLGDGPLSRGARLLALAALGRFAEVLTWQDDVFPSSGEELALFDASNCAFALATAASVYKDAQLALTHLHAARLLASALGMVYREQHIALETERLKVTLGRPDPTAIRAAMNAATMSERRTRFASVVLSEASLTLGEYRTALTTAPEGSGVAAFAAALLSRERREVVEPDDYAQMAQWLLGDEVELPSPEFEPEATYSRLLRSLALLRSPGGKTQAGVLLGSIFPAAPDQQVTWALLVLAAHADGVQVAVPPHKVMQRLRSGLAALSSLHSLRRAAELFAPRLLLLLGFMPSVPPVFPEAIQSVPIFAGNAVLWRGRGYPLPGEVGSRMLVREIQGRRPETPHPQQKRRFDQAWAAIPLEGRVPVSTAWLLKGLLWAAQGESQQAYAWAPALLTVAHLAHGEDARTALEGAVTSGVWREGGL